MLAYEDLSKLVFRVHKRFTYTSDLEHFGKLEHWVGFDEIPDGNFKGDCEDFAQAVRKELTRLNEPSRLAVCGVNSKNLNHAVCIYNNYVIDNIHLRPMLKTDLANYHFISISGYNPGEPWKELIGEYNA